MSRKRSPYVPLHVDIWEHPKFLHFVELLGVDEMLAGAYLMRLLTWAKRALEGESTLSRWPSSVVARGAHWTGDPEAFLAALVESGWVDRDEVGELVMHEAEAYGGRIPAKEATGTERRGKSSTERSRAARERARNGGATDATAMQRDATPDATGCNGSAAELQRVRTDVQRVAKTDSTEEGGAALQRDATAHATDVAALHSHSPVALQTPFDPPASPPMRWPSDKPKARTPSRGAMGMQETADKPMAEAAIRACLTGPTDGEAPHARLAKRLREFGADAQDELERLMGAWSRNYDLNGAGPAVAMLLSVLREAADKRKRDGLNSEAAKARASKQGLHVADDGTVVGTGSTKESWDALCERDWRWLTAAGEDEPTHYGEYKALYRAHYAGGGTSRWDERQRLQDADEPPELPGLVPGKSSARQGVDHKARARIDYDGLTSVGVRPGQRWVDYWAEHQRHYESGGGSRWEAWMDAQTSPGSPSEVGAAVHIDTSPIVDLQATGKATGVSQ